MIGRPLPINRGWPKESPIRQGTGRRVIPHPGFEYQSKRSESRSFAGMSEVKRTSAQRVSGQIECSRTGHRIVAAPDTRADELNGEQS